MYKRQNQTISFPAHSNLRLEEGTFETWIMPQWNGLDNNSTLTITITQDGYAISPGEVFVGSLGYHPTMVNGSFSINKNSNVSGTPNTNKDGVFIYYDKDVSGNFSRWYLRAVSYTHLDVYKRQGINLARILYFNVTGTQGSILSFQALNNQFFAPNNVILNTEVR